MLFSWFVKVDFSLRHNHDNMANLFLFIVSRSFNFTDFYIFTGFYYFSSLIDVLDSVNSDVWLITDH